MSLFRIIVSSCIISVLALPAAGASAQDAAAVLAERYTPGSIDTTDRAKSALDEIVVARNEVDSFYDDQRFACYSRFFASACLNDVRQRQRDAKSKIRKIEVEANALLRKEKAAERDRALAERDERAKQQPGGRLSPISGTAREPAPDVTALPEDGPTEKPAPSEAPAPAPANTQP